MLMDNFSYHAYHLLPVLLNHINVSELDESERNYSAMLREWDYNKDADQIAPSVFYYWWRELYSEIWDNKYNTDYPMRRPARDNTLDLILNEPDSGLFNNIETETTETLTDLINISFKTALSKLNGRYGETNDNWKWGYINRTDLNHTAQIPGLGEPGLFTGGAAETINAIRGSHGPSWRMIVELDPDGVRGYGVYPGGQTGNPGSDRYNEFVETWRTGELFELLFLSKKPEAQEEFPLKIRLE